MHCAWWGLSTGMRLANCRKFPPHQYSPISQCTDAQCRQCILFPGALHSIGKAKKAEVTQKLEPRGDVDGDDVDSDDHEDKHPKSLHPGLAQSER